MRELIFVFWTLIVIILTIPPATINQQQQQPTRYTLIRLLIVEFVNSGKSCVRALLWKAMFFAVIYYILYTATSLSVGQENIGFTSQLWKIGKLLDSTGVRTTAVPGQALASTGSSFKRRDALCVRTHETLNRNAPPTNIQHYFYMQHLFIKIPIKSIRMC